MEPPRLIEGWRSRLAKQAEILRKRIGQSARGRLAQWELDLLHETFLLTDKPNKLFFLSEVARRTARKADQTATAQLKSLRKLLRKIAAKEAPNNEAKRAYEREYRKRNLEKMRSYNAAYMRKWLKNPSNLRKQHKANSDWCKRNRDRINEQRRHRRAMKAGGRLARTLKGIDLTLAR